MFESGLASGAVFGLGSLLVAAALLHHRRLAAALRPEMPPARLDRYPSLTIIRPIKGLDAEVEANLRAGLAHGYPGEVETLFVFDDREEPALPIVERVVAEHRARGGEDEIGVLFCGAPPAGRTGKLHAMIHGLARARGECIGFVDSDVRADEDALRVAVETLLSDPKNGSASAPAVVTPAPRNLADAASAILLNGLYGASARQVAAGQGGELPFILGQVMVLRREGLRAIGELEDIAGNFVDDIQIGAHLQTAGFRNRVTPHPVGIVWLGATPGEFLANFVRWMTFSRGFPDWSFKMPIAWRAGVFFAGLLGGAGLAASGLGWVSLPWFLAAAGVTASLVRLHAAVGGSPLRPRHWIAPAVVLLLAPFVFLRVYTQRSVVWRGRRYDLDRTGRLGTPGASDQEPGTPGSTRPIV